MYATIEYDSNSFGINLYRIVNIKKATINKITEFSSIQYSEKPLFAERLIVNSDGKNYWYTTHNVSDYEFADYNVAGSDRCWNK